MSRAQYLSLSVLFALLCIGVHAHRPLEHFNKQDAGLPNGLEYEQFFNNWHAKFKRHGIEKTPERQELFRQRTEDIIRHNQDSTRTYSRKVNRFTGLFESELKGFVVMDPQNCTVSDAPIMNSTGIAGSADYFNWRDLHMITEIKNQKNCAAGWAFASSATVESHWGIRTGVPPVLSSEQQFIDCADDFNTAGCSGGLPYRGFDYLQSVNGLSTENTYPYEAQAGLCRFSIQNVIAKVYNGSIKILPGDEEAIFQAVTKFGPISVGLDVSDEFLSYDGGVFRSTACRNDTKMVNHNVVIIGYGIDSNSQTLYWLVKNSWGTTWGEEGYARIQRGSNVCGIANCASYPNLNYTNPITNSTNGAFFLEDDDAFILSLLE